MTKNARILVVDDEAPMRESLKDWLMEEGYEVGLAASGKEAITMARTKAMMTTLKNSRGSGHEGRGL